MDKIAKALCKARREREEEQGSAGHGAGPHEYEERHVEVTDKIYTDRALVNKSAHEEAGPDSFAGTEILMENDISRSASASVNPKLIVYHEPESRASEYFKLLRSHILHPTGGKELRTILVTSAMDNAGKTVVACNLALSIAQGVDPYALLIDADMRKSSIQKMFGIKPEYGLSDYLLGKTQLSSCLHKPAISKLTILPSGNIVPNPSEIVTSLRMKALLEEVKKRYADRFIIIDSPPVNLASESVDLAKLVDAILFVVRYGVSSKSLIEQAITKLGREKITGIVFNAYDNPRGKYGYYKKNSYYGH